MISAKLPLVLDDARIKHTSGVVDMACELSAIHRADGYKARLAAVLHDCAKNIDKQVQKNLLLSWNAGLDAETLEIPDIWHAYAGAEIARRVCGIDDMGIINSIKYHATGRAEMCELEEIIYLSDLLERNRKPFPGINALRALSKTHLSAAVYAAIKANNEYLLKTRKKPHSLSYEAIKYYEKKLLKGGV